MYVCAVQCAQEYNDGDVDNNDNNDYDDGHLCVLQNRKVHKESRFHIPRSFPLQHWRKAKL